MDHSAFCAQYVPSGGRVLDVGAGKGGFILSMAQRGLHTYGIEINDGYIAEANSKAKASNIKLTLVRGPAEKIPFDDNFFDFVNCAEVTEHVEDPAAVCREISRVLKPGSHGYVSFHNRFGFYDYHYHLFGINWLPRLWTEPILHFIGKHKNEGSHIGRQRLVNMHYFTYKQAVNLLDSSGLIAQDTRVKKIKERFKIFSPLLMLVYTLLARPFYFNSFHLLIVKPVL